MTIHIDKGDYLTFASIGRAVGLGLEFFQCEIEPGVWRRHPDLKPEESRSDISRDGYLGVLFYLTKYGYYHKIQDIINAGWKRGWTMGDRGNFDYVNIWPLVPLLYRGVGKSVPTIPPLAIGTALTGFRAHLCALTIMIERQMGMRRWSHKWSIERLVDHNPDNIWFAALENRILGINMNDISAMWTKFDSRTGAYGWGSCPGEVFKHLVISTLTDPNV